MRIVSLRRSATNGGARLDVIIECADGLLRVERVFDAVIAEDVTAVAMIPTLTTTWLNGGLVRDPAVAQRLTEAALSEPAEVPGA
jgi:hypothetical protein